MSSSSSSSSTVPPRATRPYQVVLYGATGFTGQLTAQYLAGATRRQTHIGKPQLAWALAGRDGKKLEGIRDNLDLDEKTAEEPEIIVANSNDQESLINMTKQTRVVISTVGPFSKYGEPLVAACVKTGTDYVDITGEPLWVASMIAKYQEEAEKTGAIISNMCGFDSLPSDLGSYLAAKELQKKYNTKAVRVQGYQSVNKGGISGGTFETMFVSMELPPAERKKGKNPYLLNPPDTVPETRRPTELDQKLPKFDTTLQRWTVPFLMALINVRVVRRSIGLRRVLQGPKSPFSAEATYNESSPMPSIVSAFIYWLVMVFGLILIVIRPTRALLQKFVLPAPGEGPSKERREQTTFSTRVVAEGENGQRVQAIISGGDPGYGDTAKMLAEAGLTLAQDRAQLELNQFVSTTGATGFVGGFFTPSLVGGEVLAERLRGAGLGVKVEEFKTRHQS